MAFIFFLFRLVLGDFEPGIEQDIIIYFFNFIFIYDYVRFSLSVLNVPFSPLDTCFSRDALCKEPGIRFDTDFIFLIWCDVCLFLSFFGEKTF